jgi:hypothetical protein
MLILEAATKTDPEIIAGEKFDTNTTKLLKYSAGFMTSSNLRHKAKRVPSVGLGTRICTTVSETTQ